MCRCSFANTGLIFGTWYFIIISNSCIWIDYNYCLWNYSLIWFFADIQWKKCHKILTISCIYTTAYIHLIIITLIFKTNLYRSLSNEVIWWSPLIGASLNINSLWPSDAIWRHRSWSTLAQVMTCCLTAPSHYLNHCWLVISKVKWHSSKGKFTRDT